MSPRELAILLVVGSVFVFALTGFVLALGAVLNGKQSPGSRGKSLSSSDEMFGDLAAAGIGPVPPSAPTEPPPGEFRGIARYPLPPAPPYKG